MAGQVLVTGATGNVGYAVVRALQQRGVPLRAAGSDLERLRSRLGDSVETARLDFFVPATFTAALAGCASLFLMRPPAIAQVRRTLLPFIDAARALGVRQVVFLSVQGAEQNPLIPHHAVERQLQAGPPGWTLLRPGFFAQNLGDAYRRDITRDGRIYVPAGSGRVAFIDARDIAEVAAMALLEPAAHAGRAYTLTGPAAISLDEAARLLSQRLGRPIRYQPASVLGYVRHLLRQGAPLGQAAVLTILHLGLRLGQAASIDPTLARLLGRPGRTLAEYIADHADLFAAERP
ncbi:MAG TPA: SDR family oxidoreductase [Pseudomonadota bacterium]|nr:SDR family oxidoreductase [Pseudomonadota bacterium]